MMRMWKLEQVENSLKVLDEQLAKLEGRGDLLKYGVAFQPTEWALMCLDDVREAINYLLRALEQEDPSKRQSDVEWALALLCAKETDEGGESAMEKEKEKKTTKWAVVHLIHVRVPYSHIAKLFITDVPVDVSAGEIKSALTRAGYWFGEFGIRWANHYLAPQDKWEDEVVGAYNSGAPRISWQELLEKAQVKD